MRPTLQNNGDDSLMMLGLGPEPIVIKRLKLNGTIQVWVDGFARITSTTPEGLEERWRAIAADPFAFVDAVTSATEEDLKLAQQAEADGEDEGELEDCEDDMERLRMTRVLLRATWDAALADAAEKIRAKRAATAEIDRKEREQNGASAWAAIYQARCEGLDFALSMLAITDAPALPFPRKVEVTTCTT